MKTDVMQSIGSTTNTVVENVTEIPITGVTGTVLYLTVQHGGYDPGPYFYNGFSWLPISTVTPSWWEPNAVVVIDGSIGTLGTNVISDPAGRNNVEVIPGWGTDENVEYTTDEFRNGTQSLSLGSGGTLVLNEGGSEAILNNLAIAGSGFTIEAVMKRKNVALAPADQYGDIRSFGFYTIFNALNNRIQINSRLNAGAFNLEVFNNTGNRVISATGAPPSSTDTNWKHQAITYDSVTKDWQHFIDGVLVYTTTRQYLGVTNAREYIGTVVGEHVYLDRYQIIPGVKYTSNFTVGI